MRQDEGKPGHTSSTRPTEKDEFERKRYMARMNYYVEARARWMMRNMLGREARMLRRFQQGIPTGPKINEVKWNY